MDYIGGESDFKGRTGRLTSLIQEVEGSAIVRDGARSKLLPRSCP
jgi:hypothetical protein